MKRVMLFVISVLLSAAMHVQAQQLLLKTGTVQLRGVSNFVAADYFKVNNRLMGIGSLNGHFEEQFLGITDSDLPDTELTSYHVQIASLDAVLRGTIDGWKPVRLSHLWWLLLKQRSGEPGFLLTNGGLNYFHIRGTDGNVWILYAIWEKDHGWSVNAVSTLGVYYVHRGSQIISY